MILQRPHSRYHSQQTVSEISASTHAAIDMSSNTSSALMSRKEASFVFTASGLRHGDDSEAL